MILLVLRPDVGELEGWFLGQMTVNKVPNTIYGRVGGLIAEGYDERLWPQLSYYVIFFDNQ